MNFVSQKKEIEWAEITTPRKKGGQEWGRTLDNQRVSEKNQDEGPQKVCIGKERKFSALVGEKKTEEKKPSESEVVLRRQGATNGTEL